MKKIAVLYSGAKIWGGVETYLFHLINDSKDKEVEFYLFSMGGWDLTRKLSPVLKDRCLVVQKSRVSIGLLVFGLPKLIRENGIDVLVSQGVVANFYARVASFVSRIPHVCVVHSELEKEYKNILIRVVYILSDRVVRWQTSRFICVSEYIKSTLVKKKINPRKITVVYNGIMTPVDQPAKDKKKTKNNKIIIGSVGRLRHEKGYDILVESAKQLPGDLEIRICGEGNERTSIETLIKKNNLQGKVKLLEFNKNINDFYGDLDLYVQPSRSEGFGLSVVEAASLGIPVIVSERGSLPELVEGFSEKTIVKELDPSGLAETIKWCVENLESLKEDAISKKDNIGERFSYERWLKETTKVMKGEAK